MAYVNTTQGARAIHLIAGGYVLVEPGATVDIGESRIKRLGPGLVKARNELPKVPADLAAAVTKAPGLKVLRAEYQAKMGKRAFPGWDADQIKRRMGV